jgi:PAS domain S-box-containing protein
MARDNTERVIASTGTPLRDESGQTTGAVLVLRDVTEQALAETALRKSQELFRRITENTTDLITVHDLDGRRVFQSRQQGSVLPPLGPDESADGFAHVHPEDLELVRTAFAAVVRTGEPKRAEYRARALDGTLRHIESLATLLRDRDGSAEKVLVVSRDITERHEAQARLRREKDFTDSLLQSLPGIFFVCDAAHRMLRWNLNFEAVTGCTPAEIVARDPLSFFAAQEQDLVQRRMQRCFSDGKVDFETLVQTSDGRAAPHYITGLRLPVNGQMAMLLIGIDLSARKAAEELLLATTHRIEKQNAALAEQARNPALRGDDLALACRTICEVAARTLGVSRVSLWFYDQDHSIIRCANLFEHPSGQHSKGQELRKVDYPNYFAALEEGRVIPAHYARNDPRTRDFTEGYLKPLGITSLLDAPIRSEGKMIGVICHEHTGSPREWTLDEQNFAGSMADLMALSLEVWQRRDAERALRDAHAQLEMKVAERTHELSAANERLQELDRLKSEFLATMSHELRTPLNSIIGFTGILRQGLAGPLNDEQQKQLGMVHFSARHLLGLINDLLDLSRIESGKMDVQVSDFQVAEVIEEVVQSLMPAARQKHLTLEANLEDNGLTLRSDRKKTFQILLNLANNAVKFTETGSVRLNVCATAQAVTFAVADTGIGIKPEQLANLFQAFRQVDGSARRVYEGTGLGLYLCKKLVALLGGTIGVESEFGRGSCFHFTLPRQPQSAHA